MNSDTFRTSENWHGSYYELSLELGTSGDDEKMLDALRLLWSQPPLYGSWTNRDEFGLKCTNFKVVDGFVAPHYGVLTINGSELGCVTHVVRETDGSDWLDLCVPTGMLELAFNVSYPLYYEPNPWMTIVDTVYKTIAASIFAKCPFQLAIIGEETSGITNAKSITLSDIERGLFVLPDPLAESLGIRSQANRCSEGLVSVGHTGG